MDDDERLLTPQEVARLFRVSPRTVSRWAGSGTLPSIRTPGGHRRFRPADVDALLVTLPPDLVPAPTMPQEP